MAGIQIDGTNQKLILDSDADTYLEAATDDTIKVYVSGAEDLRIGANAINVLSGTTLTIDSGATITNSGTANGFSSADPASADGDSLGTASLEWSDLYLADGGQILFGNDQDVLLTHVADTGLTIKTGNSTDDRPVILTLANAELLLTTDEVIGKIQWQAPDEASGTDAILVSAAIQAVAEGAHSASSNATRLEFMTGASEAATSQMAISSGGIVGIGAVPTPDLGVGLHIKTADSGADVHNDADELVIENSATGGITILSGTSAEGRINFGDSDDNDTGRINYSHASNYISFYANAAEVVRIGNNGRISSNVTSLNHGLNINNENGSNYVTRLTNTSDTNPYGLKVDFSAAANDNTTTEFIVCPDSGTVRFKVTSDGDVTNHDNSYGSTSDQRIKQNIADSSSQWNDIKAVKVRKFKMKDDVRQYGDSAWELLGVVGQELEASGMDKLVQESPPSPADILSDSSFGTLYEDGDVLPEGKNIGDVKEVKEKVKHVKYSILYMKAIKALQEAQTRIETLETKVAALEG